MNRFLVLFLLSVLISCKDKSNTAVNLKESQEASSELEQATFPSALDSVLLAHGGIESWKNQHTLQFVLKKGELTERHTIDLKSRKDKIEFNDYSMGFDGEEVWLLDPKNAYTGDAVFYHNLMFYFYAMPFVLADPGIVYEETVPLIFEDKSYPGIQIGYETGVGTSPKDQYFVHYDPVTYEMKWLGYTVTYRTGEKSDNIKWIRYNDWRTIDGILLPSSLSWYAYEGRIIKEKKSTRIFENAELSTKSKTKGFYDKPSDAAIVKKS
ncbi:DUF6503 family protein [Eudoraea chungangensis]|uniref:DUF6503 family protein n=1 Tax=Eudoraea chungangensis TaxID=1481905 RepID=UPI0023EAA1CD|nr:DUF6503 family protein [Eudoraea chungangensis]